LRAVAARNSDVQRLILNAFPQGKNISLRLPWRIIWGEKRIWAAGRQQMLLTM